MSDIGNMPTPEEMAYAYRNSLLLQCDWTQLPDVDLTTAQVGEWRIYRQELRDLPSLPDWPAVQFPPLPTE
jgi:hypothetical protein